MIYHIRQFIKPLQNLLSSPVNEDDGTDRIKDSMWQTIRISACLVPKDYLEIGSKQIHQTAWKGDGGNTSHHKSEGSLGTRARYQEDICEFRQLMSSVWAEAFPNEEFELEGLFLRAPPALTWMHNRNEKL